MVEHGEKKSKLFEVKIVRNENLEVAIGNYTFGPIKFVIYIYFFFEKLFLLLIMGLFGCYL